MSGSWICDECAATIRTVDRLRVCQRCGRPAGLGQTACFRCRHWEDLTFEVRSVYEFSGAVRDSILRMKYRGEHARAGWHGASLGRLVLDLGWTADVLVPVPLHRHRLRQRGYNQSQKLAESVSSILDTPVVAGVRRTRDTPQQTTLGVTERASNVAGAFGPAMSLAGRRVLLIDDVVTTCSTLLQCAAACRDAGCGSVRAVTLATDV